MFEFMGAYPDLLGLNVPPPQDVYEEFETKQAAIGTVLRRGGRTWVYSKNGSAALGIGKLAIQPTPVANHQNVAVAAAVAVGINQVTVTLGATLATINQYEDGYLVVSDVDGQGTAYKIRSNPAADSAASLEVTMYDKLHTALTTDSECCLIPNPYNAVVISVTDQADIPAGIPIIGITASYYFWCQTGGICPALADETIAQGLGVTIGSSVAGAVEGADAAGEPVIGYAYIAAVDTEYRPIYLTILE